MSMFGEMAKAFMHGFMHGVAEHGTATLHGQDAVANYCTANGWTVDERDGDVALLHFDTPSGKRKLSVWQEQAGGIAFLITSHARFSSVPPAVADYLLRRNPQLEVGAWATEGNQHGVIIGLTHRAHGLTGAGFRRACELMVGEVVDFDAKLRQSGLLRG